MKKQKRTKKYCKKCHQVFWVTKCFLKQKYCSVECYHPSLKDKKIKCLTCKKIFSIRMTPSNLKQHRKYCSNACCNKYKHIITHHIDLDTNNNRRDNKLKLTNSLHGLIHRIAYHYIVEKGDIKNYIKWFKSKYMGKKKL